MRSRVRRETVGGRVRWIGIDLADHEVMARGLGLREQFIIEAARMAAPMEWLATTMGPHRRSADSEP